MLSNRENHLTVTEDSEWSDSAFRENIAEHNDSHKTEAMTIISTHKALVAAFIKMMNNKAKQCFC